MVFPLKKSMSLRVTGARNVSVRLLTLHRGEGYATEEDLTFEEIIDEMICEAWHTVTHYHLRLGPAVNGNAENFLEHAINTLNAKVTYLPQNPSRDELKQAIKECEKELKKYIYIRSVRKMKTFGSWNRYVI